MLGYLRYERGQLWHRLWSDYAAALPWCYASAAVLVLAWLALARYTSARSPLWMVGIAALGGWATGMYLSGSWLGSTPLLLAIMGSVMGAVLAWFVPRPGDPGRSVP